MADIETIQKEYEMVLKQLSDPGLISDGKNFEELSKRKNFLEKIIKKEGEIKEIKNKIEENKIIILAKEDLELVSLAEIELSQFLLKEKKLEKELGNLLSDGTAGQTEEPSARLQTPGALATGGQAVIVEIRAGAGGEEAALFATNLFKMYSKYAQLQGWKQKVLDSRPTELGGFKEIIFELSAQGGSALGGKNGDVFSKMKYEGGVHRVQRIPETEKSGRIHTSTASVAVLPKPKEAEIKTNPRDLKIDVYKSSGPGGQYVNKRMTAVRITHLPSGIIVTSQTERNLQQNKENAMSILGAKLLERKEMEELEKIGDKRKLQIGFAKRAEKIRTYNFPQDRVTDHRIKKSWHNIEGIMAGNLDPLILTLQQSALS